MVPSRRSRLSQEWIFCRDERSPERESQGQRMVAIKSLLKVADDLVPVEEFVGPIVDQNYIEGGIELSVENVRMLAREQVDYVDQLWAYLVEGLEEVAA